MTGPAEPYRELLRAMIAADEPCQSPTCGITMLGHLIAGAPAPLIDLVRAEDPDAPSYPEPQTPSHE